MNEKNIYQRLHEVMKAVSYVQKGDKQVNGQYRFVGHDAVTGKVRPALIENGVLSVPQNMRHSKEGNLTIVEMDIRFVNIDKPDDFLDVPSLGYGIDSQDKGVGKAISYAVKYALLKALSLETGDDPEKDNIDHKPENKAQKSRSNEFVTLIYQCADNVELDSLLEQHEREISELDDMFKDTVCQAVDFRRGQIKNGVNPIVKHSFAGIEDQREWVKKMLPVIKGMKSLGTLDLWEGNNRAFLNGLSDKGTKDKPAPRAFMLDTLASKRAELENINAANAPIG